MITVLHDLLLPRIPLTNIGYSRRRGTYRQLSYAQALKSLGANVSKLWFDSADCTLRGGWPDSRRTDFRSE